MRSVAGIVGVALALSGAATMRPTAQERTAVDAIVFRDLAWRNLGPFRGGESVTVAGASGTPDVAFMGGDGGLWRTTDYGRTWQPIFDDAPVSAVSTVAVAPSDANTIYTGTGDGLYKSTDGGRAWSRTGLTDARHIVRVAIDPRDPNRVLVAASGAAATPDNTRGVFRSTDGGRTFARVLGGADGSGGADVAIDPTSATTVYAALWRAASSDGSWGRPGGVFKSTDGGVTWQPIGRGLPAGAAAVGRIALRVAAADPRRLFAVVPGEHGAVYRSDDAGESWAATGSNAPLGGAVMCGAVEIDPRNANVVYVAGAGLWRSADGGRSFAAIGALPPGHYCGLWLDSSPAGVIVAAGESGAFVSVNGGATWSSALNQPTATFTRVTADGASPYRVCGAGAAAGALCIASRGTGPQITSRDWYTTGAPREGAVATDPNDPDTVYTGGVARFDRRTGQVQDVTPPHDASFRALPSAPLFFAPTENGTLYFAANSVWKTTVAGQQWTPLSPDLSRGAPAPGTPRVRGAIATLSASPVDGRFLWAGTDDGLIQMTRTTGTVWTNVTPAGLPTEASIAAIEASHFDINTAYAAIDLRPRDNDAHLLRTRDGGATWVPITRGLPPGAAVNSVREDPLRRGLLFAATDRSVFVSFDDGDSWQALRLNLPGVAVEDVVVKDSDIAIATRGRGLWVLDDISTLRQFTGDLARTDMFLFRPAAVWIRHEALDLRPLAPDEPAAANPPDGLALNYWIGPDSHGPLALEIITTATGEVIRAYSSEDVPSAATASPGLHRVAWDLRGPPVELRQPDGAVRMVPGVRVQPGTYQLRLTVGDKSIRQAIIVRADARSRASAADLAARFKLAQSVTDALRRLAAAHGGSGTAAATAAAEAMLIDVYQQIDQSDARPTPSLEAAVTAAIARAGEAVIPR